MDSVFVVAMTTSGRTGVVGVQRTMQKAKNLVEDSYLYAKLFQYNQEAADYTSTDGKFITIRKYAVPE